MYNMLLKENADVALLQETKLTADHVVYATQFFQRHFEFRYSSAMSHSGGTAVLVRKNRGFTVFPEWEHDRSGRVCAVDLLCRGTVLRIVSLYAPNDPVERKTV